MYVGLNTKGDVEILIQGELWVNLECGHQIRLAAADTRDGDARIPEDRQWCSSCNVDGFKVERAPRPPRPRREATLYEMPRRDDDPSKIKYVNGKKMWLWRGSWRPY